MEQSWSELVAEPHWRREAERWIHDVLTSSGITITGPIEQPRIRPWSTQMIVPTDAGSIWFKANCPGNAFEARVQMTLAALVPNDVVSPLAIDDARGWMLTLDHGASLGDAHEPTLEDWQQVVSQAARVQQALAGAKDELTRAGLPDHSPATVPDRFDRLVERFAGLPEGHPTRITAEDEARLISGRSRLVDAVRQLEESAVPSTFQHGDVHPWNVFVDRGHMKLFDFGDAMWGFAFEAMSVPYGWITEKKLIEWEPVRDSYREHWSDHIGVREYESLWNACGLTHAVNRSATWWRGVQGCSPQEWKAWGDAPRIHLLNLLDELV